MSQLILDIETCAQDFDAMDKITQKELTKYIKNESSDQEEYENSLKKMKNDLVFSPLTGEIVSIGILDYQKNQGIVYFQAPDEKIQDFTEGDFTFKQTTEKEMLKNFWQGAFKYNEFITFNGRGFDAPYLITRSAVHKISPSKNLLANRYLNYQPATAKHIDLQDQLNFYGYNKRRGSLHLWCRAFGIESPKGEGISGDDVTRLFKEKKFIDIAKYNTRDLIATKKLYEHWRDYLRF